MYKFLLIFLVFTKITLSQFELFPPVWFGGSRQVPELSLTTLYAPTRWTDTAMPLSAYNDGYLYFNGKGSMMHTGHVPFFNLRFSSVDSFRVEITTALTYPRKLGTYLVSTSDNIDGGGWLIAYNNNFANTYEFYKNGMSGAKEVAIVTDGDTATHRLKIIWEKRDSTMRCYLDGVLKYTHTGVTFSNTVYHPITALCIGNRIEINSTGAYNSTYTSSVNTNTYKGKVGEFIFSKNDTALEYVFNQNNTQNFVPIKKIHGVVQRPLYPFEQSERWGSDSTQPSSLWFTNGANSGVDTMDALVYRTTYKPHFRDYYEDIPPLAGFIEQIWYEAFGGEVFEYGNRLYAFGNFNRGNGLTAFETDHDSIKGTARLNENTNEWEQLGYGLKTGTGTSATMFGFGYGSKIIACGYDVTAVGVGTINYVAQYDTTTGLWSAMGQGLKDAAFSGASAYGYAYIGYFADSVINSTGKKRKIVKWNGSAYDSLKGGLINGLPLCIFPDSSSGSRLLIVGGSQESFTQAGVITSSQGLSLWNEDTQTWSKYNDLVVNSGKAVYKILKHNNWYYFFGDFDYMTNGTDTVWSYGMCRFKEGTGLQAIGTGVYMNWSARGITSAVIYNNILYFAGSFTRIGDVLSPMFGAIDLTTGTIIDVGYGTDKRIEGLCEFRGKIIALGDNFHTNGDPNWIAFKYNPAFDYHDTTSIVLTHTELADTTELSFPLTANATIYKANNLSIDSAWIVWKKGANGSNNIVKMNLTSNNIYSNTIAPDTSTTVAGDTIIYSIHAVDYNNNTTISSTYNIIILANPTDYRTNLVYQWWADSNTTANTSVTTWQNTIDTLTGRQSVAGDKPTHVSNQINGRGVVRFTSNDYLNLPTINLTNFTIVFAFKSRENIDNYLLATSGQGLYVSLSALNHGIGAFDGTRLRAATRTGLDTNWHIATVTNSQVFVDGVEKSYAAAQTLTGIVFTLLGGRTDVGMYFKGDIACIRIYNTTLSSTNRQLAEYALNSKLLIY